MNSLIISYMDFHVYSFPNLLLDPFPIFTLSQPLVFSSSFCYPPSPVSSACIFMGMKLCTGACFHAMPNMLIFNA